MTTWQTVELATSHGFISTMIVPAPAPKDSPSSQCWSSPASPGILEGEDFTHVKVLARSLALEIHDRLTKPLREERLSACRVSAIGGRDLQIRPTAVKEALSSLGGLGISIQFAPDKEENRLGR